MENIIGMADIIFIFWHSPKFFLFLFISTVVDYFSAIYMDRQTEQNKKESYGSFSLICNLGILFVQICRFCKWKNIKDLFEFFNLHYPVPDTVFKKLIMPVGISFYTFQSISYTLDVYKGITKPGKTFWIFFLLLLLFGQH